MYSSISSNCPLLVLFLQSELNQQYVHAQSLTYGLPVQLAMDAWFNSLYTWMDG